MVLKLSSISMFRPHKYIEPFKELTFSDSDYNFNIFETCIYLHNWTTEPKIMKTDQKLN